MAYPLRRAAVTGARRRRSRRRRTTPTRATPTACSSRTASRTCMPATATPPRPRAVRPLAGRLPPTFALPRCSCEASSLPCPPSRRLSAASFPCRAPSSFLAPLASLSLRSRSAARRGNLHLVLLGPFPPPRVRGSRAVQGGVGRERVSRHG